METNIFYTIDQPYNSLEIQLPNSAMEEGRNFFSWKIMINEVPFFGKNLIKDNTTNSGFGEFVACFGGKSNRD